jgi:hypothetical protein
MATESLPTFLKCLIMFLGYITLAIRIKPHRALKGFQYSTNIEVTVFQEVSEILHESGSSYKVEVKCDWIKSE